MVSPAWGRFDVTRLALAQRRWLCDELASRGLTTNSVIVSDDDNLGIAAEYGFDAVELGNADLGAKFNAGYRYAAEHGADVFVHIGSDDWAHPDAFDFLKTRDLNDIVEDVTLERGEAAVWSVAPTVMAQHHITLVDLPRGLARRCEVKNHWGCIPWFLPRSVLAPSAFTPIAPGHNRGIEAALMSGLKSVQPNWEFQQANPLWCVDFKTDTNITSYRAVADSLGMTPADEDPWALLSTMYPPDLVEMAREMSQDVCEVAV